MKFLLSISVIVLPMVYRIPVLFVSIATVLVLLGQKQFSTAVVKPHFFIPCSPVASVTSLSLFWSLSSKFHFPLLPLSLSLFLSQQSPGHDSDSAFPSVSGPPLSWSDCHHDISLPFALFASFLWPSFFLVVVKVTVPSENLQAKALQLTTIM